VAHAQEVVKAAKTAKPEERKTTMTIKTNVKAGKKANR